MRNSKRYDFPVYRSWSACMTNYLMVHGFRYIDTFANNGKTAYVFEMTNELMDAVDAYLNR